MRISLSKEKIYQNAQFIEMNCFTSIYMKIDLVESYTIKKGFATYMYF